MSAPVALTGAAPAPSGTGATGPASSRADGDAFSGLLSLLAGEPAPTAAAPARGGSHLPALPGPVADPTADDGTDAAAAASGAAGAVAATLVLGPAPIATPNLAPAPNPATAAPAEASPASAAPAEATTALTARTSAATTAGICSVGASARSASAAVVTDPAAAPALVPTALAPSASGVTHGATPSTSGSTSLAPAAPDAAPAGAPAAPGRSPAPLEPRRDQAVDASGVAALAASLTASGHRATHPAQPTGDRDHADAPGADAIASVAAPVVSAPGAAAPVAAAPTIAPATSSPPVDPQPALTDSLARLRTHGDGSHELNVQLHPAELGAVNVSATIRDGQLTVTVACADEAARAAVTAALPALHHQLSSVGFGGVDVQFGGPAHGQQPGSGSHQPDHSAGQHRDQGADQLTDRHRAAGSPGADEHAPTLRRPAPDRALDRLL